MRLSKSPKGLQFFENENKAYGKLYNTMIFTKIDGTVTLDSGGWKTMHTKKCLNLIFRDLNLGVSVYQKKGEWFVVNDGAVMPFVDRMTFEVK